MGRVCGRVVNFPLKMTMITSVCCFFATELETLLVHSYFVATCSIAPGIDLYVLDNMSDSMVLSSTCVCVCALVGFVAGLNVSLISFDHVGDTCC